MTTIRSLIRNPNSHLATYVRSFARPEILLELVQRWQQKPRSPSICISDLTYPPHPLERLWTDTPTRTFGQHGDTLLRIERTPLTTDLLLDMLLWLLLDWDDSLAIQHIGWVWGTHLTYSYTLEVAAFIRDLEQKRAHVRRLIVQGIRLRIQYLLRIRDKTPYMTFPENFFETLEKYREQPEVLLTAPLEEWRLVGHLVT